MRVLVTGGTGYIGSTAVEILLTGGFDISILDDCSMGHADTVPAGVRFVQGSLLNVDEVADALTGCDAVMHFAGKSLVGESVEKPDLYHLVNVDGTGILLDQMRKQSITKIVFSSSAATYGEPKVVPILETSETNPTNPYGATKLAIDHMITAEAAAHGISAASLRYFNVAGALKADRGWLAERHNPETHLIPNVLRSTTDNPVKIFGTDWPTPDGTCIRDYVHVNEICDALTQVIEKPSNSVEALGHGVGWTVKEIVDEFQKVNRVNFNVKYGPRRKGDIASSVLENVSPYMRNLYTMDQLLKV